MCIRLELVNTNDNIILDDSSSDFSDILDKKYELSLLFDYYGVLLKENHRDIFRAYVSDDMSLSEIACELGITRQGVHDSIKRSTKNLQDYENRLCLIANRTKVNNCINEIISRLTDSDVDELTLNFVKEKLSLISQEV